MRTTTINRIGAAAVVVGLLALGVATTKGVTAQVQGTPPATPVAASSLHLVERPVNVQVIDLGPSGDTVGDLLVFNNPIYDEADAHDLGTSQGSCVRVAPGAAWECAWTVILADGQLTTEGPFYDVADGTDAVTGGTGAYQGATGQMTYHARNSERTAYDFVYDLR